MSERVLPYSRQTVTDEDVAEVERVLRSDWLTCGPMVERFEHDLAEYVGARYAVAVSSGTAALQCLSSALEPTRVDIPALTFCATANAWWSSECEFSLVDVDDRGLMKVSDVIGKPWDVVVPVHYAGQVCETSPIHPSHVVEDACHALGARYRDESRVGSCPRSLATVFSFHPVKPIATGEGGAITTNDEALAREVRSLRSHGRDENGRMVRLGYNFRMTDIQAALGVSQLRRCDDLRERRLALARLYLDRIGGLVKCLPWDELSAWHLFPIRIPNRDHVKTELIARGIGCQVHYVPVNEQPFWEDRVRGDTPCAHEWGERELSLPLFSSMTNADVERVCVALESVIG